MTDEENLGHHGPRPRDRAQMTPFAQVLARCREALSPLKVPPKEPSLRFPSLAPAVIQNEVMAMLGVHANWTERIAPPLDGDTRGESISYATFRVSALGRSVECDPSAMWLPIEDFRDRYLAPLLADIVRKAE